MITIKKLLIGLIVTSFLASLGGIIGYEWYLHDLEPYDTWKSLGSPPAKVVHLLAVRTDTIYVQAVDRKIYSCYRASQTDRSCWNIVETIPEDNLGGEPYLFSSPLPPFPDNVVEKLVVLYQGPGMAHHFTMIYAYALLSNGTVTQWTDSPPPGSFLGFLYRTIGGICVGSLIYPLLSLIIYRPRNTPKLIKYG
jgi:hypothetical protein